MNILTDKSFKRIGYFRHASFGVELLPNSKLAFVQYSEIKKKLLYSSYTGCSCSFLAAYHQDKSNQMNSFHTR